MRKRTLFFVISIFISSLLLFSCSNIKEDMENIKIYTEEFKPLNFMQDGEITGQSAEVVQELLKRMNLDKEIKLIPWSQAYQKLKNEKNIALFSTCLTKERKDRFKWVGPISTTSMYFFVKKDSPLQLDDLDDARELSKIAVMKDYAEYSILKERGFDNLVEYEDMEVVINKLVDGEIPVFVITNLTMKNNLENIGIPESAVLKSIPLSTEFEYIAFSKSTPDKIIDTWQKHLDAMKEDGTFKEIFKKWLPGETTPGVIQIFTEDYPPLSFKKDGEITGYGTEVMREILSRLDVSENIRMTSWDNAYNLALINPNFVLYTMKKTPKRKELFYWIGPIGSNRTYFYAKKGSDIELNSLEDAKKVDKIATCSSWFSEQLLKDEGFTNLVSSPSPTKNVKQLAEGEVDISIFTDITLPMIAQEAGYSIDDFEPVYMVSKGDFYITLSKDTSKEIVNEWKETFMDICNDGTLQRIKNKWLPNSELPKI